MAFGAGLVNRRGLVRNGPRAGEASFPLFPASVTRRLSGDFDFGERLNGRMPVVGGGWGVAGADDEGRLEPRRAGGVEFGRDVAEEKDFARRLADVGGDQPVAFRFALGAGGRVVVAG